MSLLKVKRARARQKITTQAVDYLLYYDELTSFKKEYQKLLGKNLYMQATKQAKICGVWAGCAV